MNYTDCKASKVHTTTRYEQPVCLTISDGMTKALKAQTEVDAKFEYLKAHGSLSTDYDWPYSDQWEAMGSRSE